MNTTAEYLTLKEVSEITRMGYSTIRKLIRAGKLKARRPSWRLVVTRNDLDAFMQDSAVDPRAS
jgi:excisionase family DNA binding protein